METPGLRTFNEHRRDSNGIRAPNGRYDEQAKINNAAKTFLTSNTLPWKPQFPSTIPRTLCDRMIVIGKPSRKRLFKSPRQAIPTVQGE